MSRPHVFLAAASIIEKSSLSFLCDARLSRYTPSASCGGTSLNEGGKYVNENWIGDNLSPSLRGMSPSGDRGSVQGKIN